MSWRALTVTEGGQGAPRSATHKWGIWWGIFEHFSTPRMKMSRCALPAPELSPLPGSWIAPRQENQFGGFLSLFEERLARRAYLRTHGQPTR